MENSSQDLKTKLEKGLEKTPFERITTIALTVITGVAVTFCLVKSTISEANASSYSEDTTIAYTSPEEDSLTINPYAIRTDLYGARNESRRPRVSRKSNEISYNDEVSQQFQKRVRNYENSSSEPREELIGSIRQFETTLANLKQALSEKNHTIELLNQEIKQQKNLIATKNRQLDSQASMFAEQQQKLTDQILELVASLELEKTRTQQLHISLKTAHEKMESAQSRSYGLEEDLVDMSNKVASLQKRLVEHQRQLNDKQNEIKRLAKSQSNSKQELSNALASLQNQLLEKETQIESQEATNRTVQNELIKQVNQLKKALRDKERMIAAQSSKYSELSNHIDDLTYNFEFEQTQNKQLRQKANKANPEVEEKFQQEIQSYNQTVADLEEKLESYEEMLAERLNKIQNLTQSVEQHSAREKNYHALDNQIDSLKNDLQTKEQALEQAKLMFEQEQDRLTRQFDAERAELLKQLEQDRQNLLAQQEQARVKLLDQIEIDKGDLFQEVEEYRRLYETEKAQSEQLIAQMEHAQYSNEELQRQIEALTLFQEEHQKNIAFLEDEITAREQQVEEGRNEITSLTDRLEDLTADLEEQTKKLEELQRIHLSSSSELNEKVEDLARLYEGEKISNTQLIQQLDQAHFSNQELQAKVDDLVAFQQENLEGSAFYEREIREKDLIIAGKESDVEQLTAKIEELVSIVDKQNEEIENERKIFYSKREELADELHHLKIRYEQEREARESLAKQFEEASTRLDVLVAKEEQLQREKSNLEEDLQEFTRLFNDERQKNLVLTEHEEHFKTKHSDYVKQIDELTNQISNESHKSYTLSQDLENSEIFVKELQLRLQQSDEQLAKAESTILQLQSGYVKQIDELHNALANEQLNTRELQDLLDHSEVREEGLRAQLDELETYRNDRNQFIADFDRQMNEKDRELENRQQEIINLTRRYGDVVAELNEKEVALGELEQSLYDLTARYETEKEKANQLQEELEIVRITSDDLIRQNETLATSRDEFNSIQSNLSEKSALLDEKEREVSILESQLVELQDALYQKQVEFDTLADSKGVVQKKLAEELTNYQEAVEAQEEKIKLLTAELSESQRKISDMEENFQILVKEHEEHELTVASLDEKSAEVDELRAELSDLRFTLEEEENRRSGQAGEIDDLKSEIAKLETRLSVKEKELEGKEHSFTMLQTQLFDQMDELSQNYLAERKKSEELQHALDNTVKASDTHQQQSQILEQRIANLQDELKQQQIAVQQKQYENQLLKVELLEVNDSIEKIRRDTALKSQAQNDELVRQIDELNQRLDAERLNAAELNRALRDSIGKSKNQEQSQQILSLQNELDEHKELLNMRQQTIRDLQLKILQLNEQIEDTEVSTGNIARYSSKN